MKTIAVWGLVILNTLLLTMFVGRMTRDNSAFAQTGAGRPGDYLMVPGEVLGGNNAVVYILDQSSRQLSAMSYDDASKKIINMPPLNLDRYLSNPNGRNGRR